MNRDEILKALKEREADLARKAATAALFGSVARDQQRSDGDTDILADIDPCIVATMFVYAENFDRTLRPTRSMLPEADRDAPEDIPRLYRASN